MSIRLAEFILKYIQDVQRIFFLVNKISPNFGLNVQPKWMTQFLSNMMIYLMI